VMVGKSLTPRGNHVSFPPAFLLYLLLDPDALSSFRDDKGPPPDLQKPNPEV